MQNVARLPSTSSRTWPERTLPTNCGSVAAFIIRLTRRSTATAFCVPPLSLGRPRGERRERRIGSRLLGRRDEFHSGLARVGIEPEGEELRRERAEVDLAADDRIGIILVGKRKSQGFARRRAGRTLLRSRREADVDGLIDSLGERLEAYMIKAVREAKQQSSWSNPNAAYEAALRRFVLSVLDAGRTNPFLDEFHAFVGTLARPGAVASLAQLALKLTVPGVPDIYQGGELWDFSLVDPDNRRPVDWDLRRALCERIAGVPIENLSESWQDGREKLFATQRLLALRRAHPGLFAEGDYQPLEAEGEKRDHLCSFARRHGDYAVVVAVPRLLYRLYGDANAPDWGRTEIFLPPAAGWRDWFTGRRLDDRLRAPAARLFADFPVSVLLGVSHKADA